MTINRPITRRTALKGLLGLSWGVAVPAINPWSPWTPGALARGDNGSSVIEGFGQENGYSVKNLTRKMFDAAGGISRFISRGDVVVLKPNISWARSPDLAATTNPELLESMIELCYEAGAKKVRIADNTIHDARRCFALTGVGTVAKNGNADLVIPRSSMMKKMKIRGHRLDVWPVFTPVVEADKLINIPVAKHHSLTALTLGMKNWIGAVGGRRYALHQDIHQTVVDLARFFNPTCTLIDATRVLVRNGPSGGSLSDVVTRNRLILSEDPVAADAMASLLFDYDPGRIGYIKLAQEQGLGTYDTDRLIIKRITL